MLASETSNEITEYYDYDTNGNLVKTSSDFNAGKLKTFNSLGQLTSIDHNGINETYTYGSLGLMHKRIIASNDYVVNHSHNDRLQPISVGLPEGDCTIEYNSIGQLYRQNYTSGIYTGITKEYIYNNDLLLSEINVYQNNIQVYDVSYGFNNNLELSSITSGNLSVEIIRDSLGRESNRITKKNGISILERNLEFDKLNRIIEITNSIGSSIINQDMITRNEKYITRIDSILNGTSLFTNYTYNANDSLATAIAYDSQGNTIDGKSFGFTYDTNGNISQWNGYNQNLVNTNIGKRNTNNNKSGDKTNAITGLNSGNLTIGETSFSDSEGFWLFDNEAGNEHTQIPFSHSNNQYQFNTTVESGSKNITYDSQGNVASDGKYNYTWDIFNRLVSVTNSDQEIYYSYDSKNVLIRKVVIEDGIETSSETYINIGWNKIITIADNSIVEKYFYGTHYHNTNIEWINRNFGLAWYESNGNNYIPCHDSQGNINVILSDSGSITNICIFSPFGEKEESIFGTEASPFGMHGKFEDYHTKHIYWGHRWFNTNNKQWLSTDPIGKAGSRNNYTFLDNIVIDQEEILGMLSHKQKMYNLHNKLAGLKGGAISAARNIAAVASVSGESMIDFAIYSQTTQAKVVLSGLNKAGIDNQLTQELAFIVAGLQNVADTNAAVKSGLITQGDWDRRGTQIQWGGALISMGSGGLKLCRLIFKNPSKVFSTKDAARRAISKIDDIFKKYKQNKRIDKILNIEYRHISKLTTKEETITLYRADKKSINEMVEDTRTVISYSNKPNLIEKLFGEKTSRLYHSLFTSGKPKSNYTSFTTNKEIAERFAKENPSTINIIKIEIEVSKTHKTNKIVESLYKEQEYLIRNNTKF